MKIIHHLLLLFFFSGSTAYANIEERCIKVNSTLEYEARYSMINDFHLDENNLDLTKTTLHLLNQESMTELLTQELALKSIQRNPNVSFESAQKKYNGKDLQRLMVQFSYFNWKGKENIILLSTVSADQDYRCVIGLSDYLIVKREF